MLAQKLALRKNPVPDCFCQKLSNDLLLHNPYIYLFKFSMPATVAKREVYGGVPVLGAGGGMELAKGGITEGWSGVLLDPVG